jgi:AraC-like DNA-binding protein
MKTIRYMENNLNNKISIEDVSNQAFMSTFHFQRIFTVVTGITVGEYLRNRRLSQAGLDLLLEKSKVIDIAMRYQYDTSESFSKEFNRFHGIPPSAVKKHGDKLRCFDPITVNIFIQGGFNMSRKIMENEKGVRLIREKFEYKHTGKLRFIGLDRDSGEVKSYQEQVYKSLSLLQPLMAECISEISDHCYLEHHNGGQVNVNETGIFGRFFKADTPVPAGCIYYDVPTVNIGYGIYCGDESFGGDCFDAYEFTRDQILSDGVNIPYPEAYWTAVQNIDGEPKKGKYRFGYIFGVGEISGKEVK